MAARDIEPELFLPKKRFWIVGPTYDLGEKEFRIIWDDLFINLKVDRSPELKSWFTKGHKSFNKRTGDMYIEFPWQTRLDVRSAAYSKEKNLIGEGLDGVIMSEAAKHDEETWNKYVRPALSDKRGWATFVTTPEGYNWLYNIFRYGKDPLFPEYESWRFPSWENTIVYPGGERDPEITLLRKTLLPEEFDQEIAALFTATTGRIYPEFSEDTHVTDWVFRPQWANYITFDWGFTDPLVALEFQVSPSQDVVVWREHYVTGLILEDHLNMLKSRSQPPGYHLDCTYGDPADPEAVATVNQRFAPCVALDQARHNWRQGVDLVKKFLVPRVVGEDETGAPIYRPKMMFDRQCVNAIKEFSVYRKKDKVTNEHTAGGAANHGNSHCPDAMRYGMMHVFELGAQHHLSELSDINPLMGNSPLEQVGAGGYFTSNMRF